MATESNKLACVFEFPDGTRHEAQAHLFWHNYDGKVFWFGAAHFIEPPSTFPEGTNGGRVTFEDRRTGGVTFLGGLHSSGGYFQVGFSALTYLESPRDG